MQLKLFSVRIPEKLIERVKIRAVKRHISVQELTARALEDYLKQPRGEDEE